MNRSVLSRHARDRASQRQIPRKSFRAANSEATRINLLEHLENQHRKFASMLTKKMIRARVGRVDYRANNQEISTRLSVAGATLVVGIRKKGGKGYTPLTITTVWS